MSKVTVLNTGGEWEVWIGLNDGATPPDGLNYIIGIGPTRRKAVLCAYQDLEQVILELHRVATEALWDPTEADR